MKKFFLVGLIMIILAFALPLRQAQTGEFPIGYPFSSWGEARISSNSDVEESAVLDSYFEQGIDWWEFHGWTLDTFAGIHFVQGSDKDYYWDNKFNPLIGVKVKHPFRVFPKAWGEIDLGARGEYYNYTSGSSDDDFIAVPFFQWSFGGDWKDLNALTKEVKKKSFPLGYPFSSWGEVRYSKGDIDEGLVLDCYFEQGIDLYQWRKMTFNSFAGLHVVQSSEDEDYWNNKVVPQIGIKVKHPFRVFPKAWGEIDLGVRGEYYSYTSSPSPDDEFRVVFFLQWSFGGDWKKR